MEDTDSILLAVGGVLIITWYGVTRWKFVDPVSTEDARIRMRVEQPPSEALIGEFTNRDESESDWSGGTVECPSCGSDYPAGTLYCSCGSETVEVDEEDHLTFTHQLPTAFNDTEQDTVRAKSEDVVCIYTAENTWKAALVSGILENHQIPCSYGANGACPPYQFSMMPMGEVKLFVYKDDMEEAQRILKTLFS